MPTHEIERRFVFTPAEVLAALQLAYPDLPEDPPFSLHLLAKLGSASHPLQDIRSKEGTILVSLTRNLDPPKARVRKAIKGRSGIKM